MSTVKSKSNKTRHVVWNKSKNMLNINNHPELLILPCWNRLNQDNDHNSYLIQHLQDYRLPTKSKNACFGAFFAWIILNKYINCYSLINNIFPIL